MCADYPEPSSRAALGATLRCPSLWPHCNTPTRVMYPDDFLQDGIDDFLLCSMSSTHLIQNIHPLRVFSFLNTKIPTWASSTLIPIYTNSN